MKVIKAWNSIPIINQKRLYCIPTPSFMSGNAIGKIILHGMAFVTDLNNGTLTKLESCFAYCRLYTGVRSQKLDILQYSEEKKFHIISLTLISFLNSMASIPTGLFPPDFPTTLYKLFSFPPYVLSVYPILLQLLVVIKYSAVYKL